MYVRVCIQVYIHFIYTVTRVKYIYIIQYIVNVGKDSVLLSMLTDGVKDPMNMHQYSPKHTFPCYSLLAGVM